MRTKKERIFIHLSCCLALIHALGYVWLGIQEEFTVCIYAMITLDVLYVPASMIKSVKIFPVYLVVFSCALIFITAFITSELFNNYSALLCLYVAILIFPKHRNILMGLYLVVSAIAFCVAEDPVYYLVIHYSRALWIFTIYNFIVYAEYNRKPVILFDEEIEILKQLTDGEQMKSLEINGLSERTIRRRLDEAQKRNGLSSRKELEEVYKKTYKKSN